MRSQLDQNLVVQPEADEIRLLRTGRVPNHLGAIHFQLQPKRDVRQQFHYGRDELGLVSTQGPFSVMATVCSK